MIERNILRIGGELERKGNLPRGDFLKIAGSAEEWER